MDLGTQRQFMVWHSMAAFKVDVRRSPIATAVQTGIIYPGPSFYLGTDLGAAQGMLQ